MAKEDVLKDIQSLMENIDNCENELVKARLTDDISRLVNAYCQSSRLLVQTRQELDFLYRYIACLWKDAQKDELPEYDREVVVFTCAYDVGIMRVDIGHRPNPEGWDGKSLTTGKV